MPKPDGNPRGRKSPGLDGRAARLIATRDLLADALESCESARDLPALAREYRMVLAELDSLTGQEETSVVDQLAQRRHAKTATGTAGAP